MTDLNTTDLDAVILELYESIGVLNSFSDLVPHGDPSRDLLAMISERVDKAGQKAIHHFNNTRVKN